MLGRSTKDGINKVSIDRGKLESIASTFGIDLANKNDLELYEAIDLAFNKGSDKTE